MDQKKQILQTSIQLFMRYGIKSVTMDDVAKELGISKKTLYQYIDNKKDLILQAVGIYVEEEKEMLRNLRKNSSDAVDEMLSIASHVISLLRQTLPSTSYDLKKYYKESWNILQNFHQEHLYGEIKHNLEWGKKEELYRKEIDADIIAKLYVSKSDIISSDDLFPPKDYKRDELFNEFIHYHLYGIVSKKGLDLLSKYQKAAKNALR